MFLAALGLHCCARAFSSCREQGLLSSCGAQASHCSGCSCCRARPLVMQVSVSCCMGAQHLQLWVLDCRFSSCGTWAQLSQSMWYLPRQGNKSVFPVFQGGYLASGLQGKPKLLVFVPQHPLTLPVTLTLLFSMDYLLSSFSPWS